MTLWQEGRVSKIAQESPNVRRFWVEIPENSEPFRFRAGQFVTMDLPIGERRLARWRSYSIANSPEKEGVRALEFCIVLMPGGAGSTYFFEQIKVGSMLKFKGPDGNFCLPENIENDLVFIATGTGIAPFRSMLADLKSNPRPHKKLHLIFGARTENDILYRKEIEEYRSQLVDYQLDIALSREKKDGYFHGHLHQIYLEKYAEKRPDVRFLICGWSKMIDQTVENLLLKMGYDRSQILYELYG
jgi:CDP-4-dehydro-6-deoxyglucose reductase